MSPGNVRRKRVVFHVGGGRDMTRISNISLLIRKTTELFNSLYVSKRQGARVPYACLQRGQKAITLHGLGEPLKLLKPPSSMRTALLEQIIAKREAYDWSSHVTSQGKEEKGARCKAIIGAAIFNGQWDNKMVQRQYLCHWRVTNKI
ncbi:hypothetical protein CAPTEDRAFT_198931 [Capitella teleta]|uniref:Uncharacterized protein n=1 Tax=Capitella teleta TaxID=283909 RepID=R7UZE0_CAPTE|nr:hypothetical protein CAPTEDRAFT_198931 [Capitella teleta]|eukprot:ELU09327.1 hypothetical protein CAPTEDRAFT_198931 [Capitella teleta]